MEEKKENCITKFFETLNKHQKFGLILATLCIVLVVLFLSFSCPSSYNVATIIEQGKPVRTVAIHRGNISPNELEAVFYRPNHAPMLYHEGQPRQSYGPAYDWLREKSWDTKAQMVYARTLGIIDKLEDIDRRLDRIEVILAQTNAKNNVKNAVNQQNTGNQKPESATD